MTFIVTGTSPVRALTPGEEQDARDAGVLESRTTASLVGSQDLAVVVAGLKQDLPDQFAGAAIESGAGYEAWIAFVGRAPAGVVERLQGLPIDVQVREDAALTGVQRRRAVEVALAEVVRVVDPPSIAAGMTSDDVLFVTVEDVGEGIDVPAVAAVVRQAIAVDLGVDPSAVMAVRVDLHGGPVFTRQDSVEGAGHG